MKLAIVGSRTFRDYTLFERVMKARFRSKPSLIISGGAEGADSMAETYALANDIGMIVHLPEWQKHGKAAGPIRNELIIKDCDIVLAFWDGISKGTANSLSIAKRLKKPSLVIYT